MSNWTAENWVTLAGGLVLVIGALTTMAVKIIEALKRVKEAIQDHDLSSAGRLAGAQEASKVRHQETVSRLVGVSKQIKNGNKDEA